MGFQSSSKLLWSNSWIAQTLRQWIPDCRTSKSEGTATEGAAADTWNTRLTSINRDSIQNKAKSLKWSANFYLGELPPVICIVLEVVWANKRRYELQYTSIRLFTPNLTIHNNLPISQLNRLQQIIQNCLARAVDCDCCQPLTSFMPGRVGSIKSIDLIDIDLIN